MSGFLKQKVKKLHRYSCRLFDRVYEQSEVAVPLVLAFLLVAVVLANEKTAESLVSHAVSTIDAHSVPAPYPVLPRVLGVAAQRSSQSESERISALSYVVVDDNSKAVVLAKNHRLRLPMASTAKLMTALVAIEHFRPSDILTIYDDHVDGATVEFVKGEKFTLESLLYALLLPSANDAAVAIAKNYPGGVRAFIRKMNEKGFALRLFETNFSDSAGLIDEGDYTTAMDLARLSSFALKNSTIARIVRTKEKTIATTDGKKTYNFSNLNKLLAGDTVTGIKTGFTDGAGGVLTTSVVEDGHTIIIVVMKSRDRFADTQKLLSKLRGITYVSTHL